MTSKFSVVEPDKQISFSHKLAEVRDNMLREALREAVDKVGIRKIDEELYKYAGEEKVEFVAKVGLRGERIYPVPSILRQKPTLLGYYRLLYGLSKNQDFYDTDAPFSKFKRVEEQGVISDSCDEDLPELCKSLSKTAWRLINNINEPSSDHLDELILLTLGAQFSGSHRARKGLRKATEVYEIIKETFPEHLKEWDDDNKQLKLENNKGRTVLVIFSSDPDVIVKERVDPGNFRNLLVIEIKGGSDRSNIHNRLGEAEKSHGKIVDDYDERWTLINVEGISKEVLKQETPSTTQSFVLDKLKDKESEEYKAFKEQLGAILQIQPE